MSLLNAHIFKRRSRGDREEVRIKLFNLDGTDADLGSGGGEPSIFFGGSFNEESLIDNSGIGHELPLGASAPRVEGEFELAGGHVSAPVGAYAVRVRGVWTDVGAPSAGHLLVRLIFVYGESNNEDVIFEKQSSAPDLVLNFDETLIGLPPDNGYFKLFIDQNTSQDEFANPNFQGWVTLVKL